MKLNILSYFDYSEKSSDSRNLFVPNDEDTGLIRKYLQEKVGSNRICWENTLERGNLKFRKPKGNILFYSQSDTLANSVYKTIQGLSKEQYRLLVPKCDTEGASLFFQKKNIPYQAYSYSILYNSGASCLVLLNDWSKEARRIIAHCRLLKIPTVCLQESIIDFGDSFKRMQHADIAFIQGVHTALELDHPNCYVTGNPRYEKVSSITEHGTGGKALVNCNFTYGVFEQSREKWLSDILTSLNSNNQDYIISQHPRDTGDLRQFKNVHSSESSSITDDLKQSAFVITRFSSLVHETLIQGKPVIYYNPHGEKMQYDFNFNEEFLLYASNLSELTAAIGKIQRSNLNLNRLRDYLTIHCLPQHSIPSRNITDILLNKRLTPRPLKFMDIIIMLLFHRILLSGFDKLLKLLNIR